MLTKFVRSVTPRAAGVLILLVAGAVAAAVTVSTGGGTNAPVHRLSAPAGAKSASSGKSSDSSSSISNAPIVSQAIRHDTSIPLRLIKPAAIPHRNPRLAPDAGDEDSPGKQPGGGADPIVQDKLGAGQIPSTSVNFEGINAANGCNCAPPDPNGAVGANNYVEIVNSAFAVYSKTGATVLSTRPTNTLWSGFGGNCQATNDGDATVVYDHFNQRWVFQQFQVDNLPFSDCIAVSTSSDPTGSYNRYEFVQKTGSDFDDYPKLGIWSDGYYISYNIFANGQNYSGPEVCALDKNAMLQGLAATQQCFKKSSSYFSLLPADIDGATLPPAGSPELLLSMGSSSLQLWKFHVDWATPANSSLSGPTTIAVSSFSQACGGGTCVPQPGTSQKLDSLGDRLMYRLAYRNFGDHEALVVAQSVSASGATGMRWYELRGPWTSPTVYQSGTYAPSDGTYRWMGSVAEDHAGDIALGFAKSSSSVRPGAGYTGRLVGDARGTMGLGEGVLVNGVGSQTGGLSRWGDYTSLSVDPTDDCTFWYLGEYLGSNGSFTNWRTRIGAFTFPSCSGGGGGNPPPVVSSFSPPSGDVGTNVDVLGSGFTGVTGVTFGGIPATTYTFNSDGELHATVPTGAVTGPITVTTPNGPGSSSTNFTVTTGGGGGSAPTVSSFLPTSGAVGTPVTITGTGFTGATAVTFNGTPATFSVSGDTSINTTVPTGATTGLIAVTNTVGTGTSLTNFTVTTTLGRPTISGFSPTFGIRGSQVTITGTNFALTGTTVKLGTITAVASVNSTTSITATVPSSAARFGFYRWSVTTPAGTATAGSYYRVTG